MRRKIRGYWSHSLPIALCLRVAVASIGILTLQHLEPTVSLTTLHTRKVHKGHCPCEPGKCTST
jgi:hypothetical protein